ncbi:MAG: response regulator [Mesorhizobium sp.]|nr:response regulator [Mesorhizobium sp.]
MLIDDDEEDYILTRDLLEDIADVDFELEWLPDAGRAVDVVCENRHDLYLVDYGLGDRDGLTVIREAVARGASAPMILLTGMDERAIDLDAMRAGAADFLEKYRSKEEVQKMRSEHDPIEQVRARLIEKGWASEDDLKAIDKDVRDIVADAAEFAQNDAEPDASELWTDVLL